MRLSLFAAVMAVATSALATPALNVEVEGIERLNAPIPAKFALCQASDDGKSKGGENTRPTIRWSGAPAATQSFAILVKDPDVPADFADAGKEGKTVKADAKRQLFYHWALADIPAATTEIPGGPSREAPDVGVAATGSLKKYVDNPTQYGGPCPPWNDEKIHHYHFTVYALDVATLKLPANPSAAQLDKALAPHVLASGSAVGTYTLNRALR